MVSRFSRWPPRRPSWISERNDFSNSDSLCHSDALHQVSAQSDLRFGRRCHLKNFDMAAMAAIKDIGTILAILNLLFSTIFCYLFLDFHVKTGTRISLRDKWLFEIREVEITRVDCISVAKVSPG